MTHIVWYLCGLFRLSKSLESAGRKVAFPPGNMKRLRIFIGAHRGTISQSQTAHLKESGQFEFTHSDIPPCFSRDILALLVGKTLGSWGLFSIGLTFPWVVRDLNVVQGSKLLCFGSTINRLAVLCQSLLEYGT